MSGLSDFVAKNVLQYVTGQTPMPVLPGGTLPTYASGNFTSAGVWLALMTAVDTDAGTGGTEVSGGAYARVQVAGEVAATATWTTATANITMTTIPAWVVAIGPAGLNVFDATTMQQIGTVLTWTTTALVLTANASHASSGSTDNLIFSAFSAATGSAPSTITNGSVITFPAATASWGTVIAFELRDALTSGNLLAWDFLGNFSWLPFEIPTASATCTAKAHGYASNDPIVFTAEYGGTLPSLSTGTMTGYTVNFVASPATDTFNADTTSGPTTAIVTTSSGSGMVRKIVQQSIPNGVTASFAASALTITAA